MASNAGTSLDAAFNKSLQLAFPPVMVRLLQELIAPQPSFTSISAFLRMDPMLTSKVLQVANSSSYGFSEKITDIQRATVALGTMEIFKLVVSLSLQKTLNPVCKRTPESLFGDWHLTLWSALAAERITDRLAPHHKQQAYMAGLLKDLPLFLAFCREELPPFLSASAMSTLPLPRQFSEERAFWGHIHPELSYNIFLAWELPVEAAEAARAHHDLAHVDGYAPLTQSLIYATRWAELLLAPTPDTAALISFEISLAAVLGLTEEEMTDFRGECAAAFDGLLAQLGIHQRQAETRLHNQSLSLIKNYHFLAMETVGKMQPFSPPLFASSLRKQLRNFWNIDSFELFLCLPDWPKGSLFRCTSGKLLPEETISPEKALARAGSQCLPLASGRRKFGFINLSRSGNETQEFATLPLFVHVLALHLAAMQEPEAPREAGVPNIGALPFALARLNGSGNIKDASRSFLDMFGLSQVPSDITAKGLLDARLGISLPHWEAVTSGQSDVQGWFTLAPEGHYPGTPIYLGLAADPKLPGDVYLFLGDITQISPTQSIALSHRRYLDALFNSLREQVYLLDVTGAIFWAPPSNQSMLGKNIFTLARPDATLQLPWNEHFLARLGDSTRIQAIMPGAGDGSTLCELFFSPLPDSSTRQYLLAVREIAPRPAEQQAKRAPEQDPVSGLPMHTQFHARLAREVERALRLDLSTGILYCDLQDFHRVNSMYGYQTGDAILRRVGICLESVCREGKDAAFRYGNDDFILLVGEASPERMEETATALLHQIHTRCHGAVTVSIGLTLIRPSESPTPRVRLAADASKSARGTPKGFYWAK